MLENGVSRDSTGVCKVRACFYGETSLVTGLPSIPSHPARKSVSYEYVSILIAANRLYEKLQSWLGGQGDPGGGSLALKVG